MQLDALDLGVIHTSAGLGYFRDVEGPYGHLSVEFIVGRVAVHKYRQPVLELRQQSLGLFFLGNELNGIRRSAVGQVKGYYVFEPVARLARLQPENFAPDDDASGFERHGIEILRRFAYRSAEKYLRMAEIDRKIRLIASFLSMSRALLFLLRRGGPRLRRSRLLPRRNVLRSGHWGSFRLASRRFLLVLNKNRFEPYSEPFGNKA